ncbi:hypothetical protein PoB_007157400 [Plakobranchus ocellatus]|uniref:Uncharacterized protein n=1 Tax=Plakobranchus ocellatus TaxID=259542 RepID=A0AAV4DLK8_9GAST|nr:hypothetical protein PoB_007157400 [Plakobranchus ocellatus]
MFLTLTQKLEFLMLNQINPDDRKDLCITGSSNSQPITYAQSRRDLESLKTCGRGRTMWTLTYAQTRRDLESLKTSAGRGRTMCTNNKVKQSTPWKQHIDASASVWRHPITYYNLEKSHEQTRVCPDLKCRRIPRSIYCLLV